MEPIVAPLIAKAGDQAVGALEKEADGFLKAIVKQPAESLGGLLADQINAIRHKNLINIVVKAKRNLDNAGISPREVPLKIIHPLLENASFEGEPDLQTTWANLLSNAADPRYSNVISMSFPLILREFGIREVRFLDALYKNTRKVVEFRTNQKVPVAVQDIDYQRDELMELYAKAGLSRTKSLKDLPLEYYANNKNDVDADISDFSLILSVVKRHNILEEVVS